MEVDKFIGPLIQLAPKVFALAGEAQIAIGLFSIVKNYLSGDEALKAMDYAEGEFYQNGEDEEEEEN
jgi:hypothetical protein